MLFGKTAQKSTLDDCLRQKILSVLQLQSAFAAFQMPLCVQ